MFSTSDLLRFTHFPKHTDLTLDDANDMKNRKVLNN